MTVKASIVNSIREATEERLFKYYARYCNRKYSVDKFFILAILIAIQLTSTESNSYSKKTFVFVLETIQILVKILC